MSQKLPPAAPVQAKHHPMAAVTALIGWIAATDRNFRQTQSMIDATGTRF